MSVFPFSFIVHPLPLHCRGKQGSLNAIIPARCTVERPSEDNIHKLAAWCRSSGIHSPLLNISKVNGHRGLFATRAINPGDEVISIPRNAALIVDVNDEKPPPFLIFKSLESSFWQTIPWYTRLAILLLDTCLAGPHSKFSTYVNALPKEPNSVLWAYQRSGRSSLVHQLSRYHMLPVVDRYRGQVKTSFLDFREALPSRLRHLVSLESFCWAISNVASRAFGIPPAQSRSQTPAEYALLPMLDMANCSVHIPTTVKYDEQNETICVETGAAFSPGEQLYLSYGSKSNDDFMFFYGFVEGNNPANTVIITDFREWILNLAHEESQDSSLWDRKLEILVSMGLTSLEKSFCFRADEIDKEIMVVLRVALASSSQLDVLEDSHKTSRSKRMTSIDLPNELAAWQAILDKCETLLHELPPFTTEETRILQGILEREPCTAEWNFSEPQSAGELLYRHERTRVLEATIERASHFQNVSKSVGRVCTVLLPPSQHLLRTDLFQFVSDSIGAADIRKFDVSASDIPDSPS